MSLVAADHHDSERLAGARLNALRAISLLDGILLVLLVRASVRGGEEAIAVLGPTHGVLFLLLVASLFHAAQAGRASWRLAIAVMILGPLVSIPSLELYRAGRIR